VMHPASNPRALTIQNPCAYDQLTFQSVYVLYGWKEGDCQMLFIPGSPPPAVVSWALIVFCILLLLGKALGFI